MLRSNKSGLITGLVVGLAVPFLMGMVTPAFAKSISFKDAGLALWIFIVIGAIIVLLQLIPAAILFFSFIGGGSAMVFKGKKASKEAAWL